MTRDDCIWVGIKILGLYLIVLAILALPQLLYSTYMFVSMTNFGSTEDTLGQTMAKLAGGHLGHGLKASAQLFLCAGFGWYFLRRGATVLRLVSGPIPEPGTGASASKDADARPSDRPDTTTPSEGAASETR